MCANQVVVANLQVVVANQQAVLANVQMFSCDFAMRLCSSVVGGSEVSDATTWTIPLKMEVFPTCPVCPAVFYTASLSSK